jgi:anti-sigma B factor antagonist
MSFTIDTRKSEDSMVLELAGRLTLGEPVEVLHTLVLQRLAEGERKIVLDLGKVTYVDSSGLGALVRVLTTTRRGGGHLHLSNITPRVQDLLEVGRLFQAFQLVESASAQPPS